MTVRSDSVSDLEQKDLPPLGVKEEYDSSSDEEASELTPKEMRWLKTKCFLFYLLIAFSYSIVYLDKSYVSSASLLDLRSDFHMKGRDYSWVNSSYFIGFIVGSLPFVFLVLDKFGTRWNGLALISWGIVTAASGGAQNYAGYIACRTLLGLLESLCEPTIMVITHQWLHPDMHMPAIELWFAGNGIAAIMLNAVSYGLYIHNVKHDYSINAWRILAIVLGLITVLFGVAYWFVVPNSPQEAKFLSQREKAVMRRIEFNEVNKKFTRQDIKWGQIVEALTKTFHHTFFLFVGLICNSLNGGAVNTYINLILKQVVINQDGKLTDIESTKRSLLFGMVPGAIKAVGCTLVSLLMYLGFMKNYRFFYILVFLSMHLASCAMLMYDPHADVQLAGVWLYNFTVEAAHGGIISIIASNVGGYTKKIFVNAAVSGIAFSVGNIVGPQIFTLNKKYTTEPARRAIVALSAISLGMLSLLFVSYIVDNYLRDKRNEKLPEGVVDPLALTDVENPEFRYHL